MMREYQTNKLYLKFDYETIERDFDIYQIKQKAEGKTIDEIADWEEKNKERNISVRRFWTTYQKSSISLRYNGYMEILLWSY